MNVLLLEPVLLSLLETSLTNLLNVRVLGVNLRPEGALLQLLSQVLLKMVSPGQFSALRQNVTILVEFLDMDHVGAS